jgi:hypothetical protein
MYAGKYVTRGRKNIGSTWSKNTCLVPLAATQSIVLQDPEGCRRQRCLNNNVQKQAIHTINKKVNKHGLETKQTVLKDSTRCYEHVSIRIA